MTEIQRYQLLRRVGEVEIREYEPHTLVTVRALGNLAEAGTRGFSPLFAFITGANSRGESIAMTSPVLEVPVAGGYEVSFVMPAGASPETVPAPRSPELAVRAVPKKIVAARRFSGLANEAAFRRQGERLLGDIRALGLAPVGEVFYARYDGPFTLGPFRRNESLIELSSPEPGVRAPEKLDN